MYRFHFSVKKDFPDLSPGLKQVFFPGGEKSLFSLHSVMKIREDVRLRVGKPRFLLFGGNALYEKGDIATEGTHGLQPFEVFFDFFLLRYLILQNL